MAFWFNQLTTNFWKTLTRTKFSNEHLKSEVKKKNKELSTDYKCKYRFLLDQLVKKEKI